MLNVFTVFYHLKTGFLCGGSKVEVGYIPVFSRFHIIGLAEVLEASCSTRLRLELHELLELPLGQ